MSDRYVDNNYDTKGYFESDGTIRNKDSNSIGKIESDGTIRDRDFNSIGKVESDGTIRDRDFNSIGYAKNIPKEWAAVVFFFFPFE
jgi:hypothetical protein